MILNGSPPSIVPTPLRGESVCESTSILTKLERANIEKQIDSVLDREWGVGGPHGLGAQVEQAQLVLRFDRSLTHSLSLFLSFSLSPSTSQYHLSLPNFTLAPINLQY